MVTNSVVERKLSYFSPVTTTDQLFLYLSLFIPRSLKSEARQNLGPAFYSVKPK